MLDQLLSTAFVPFTLALALLFGLLLLELVFALLGGTLLGAGGEGLDGPDLDVDLDVDLDLEVDVPEIDGPEIDGLDTEIDTADVAGPAPVGGLAGWLGFGKMPMLIWLASVLMAFGLSGLALQMVAQSVLGGPLWPGLVAVPAAVAAVLFARGFGTLFARALPKSETEAVSERRLARRKGVVTQGTAARGRPAEVKVIDRYGNAHYLRAEPLRDDVTIAQGSEVVVLRAGDRDGFVLVPLTG